MKDEIQKTGAEQRAQRAGGVAGGVIAFRPPAALAKRLRASAKARGLSISEVVVALVENGERAAAYSDQAERVLAAISRLQITTDSIAAAARRGAEATADLAAAVDSTPAAIERRLVGILASMSLQPNELAEDPTPSAVSDEAPRALDKYRKGV